MSTRLNVFGDDGRRQSVSEIEDYEEDDEDLLSQRPAFASYSHRSSFSQGLMSRLAYLLPSRLRSRGYRKLQSSKRQQLPRVRQRRCRFWLHVCLGLMLGWVVITALFNPSYIRPPKQYIELQKQVKGSDLKGRANPANQKVFIATSLYDEGGHILRGPWGRAVLDLIDMLGSENVYLSIYENAGDDESKKAQAELLEKVTCKYSIVYDKEFVIEDVPHVELPDGSRRMTRTAFLAAVRNKALEPLEEEAVHIQFDKILYLNDVVFNAVDAAQLLFSTNQDQEGRASYRAACAMDFANPFKFYDTFASRDMDGFGMGVIFFPWFSSAGNATSRHDVLRGTDAVRVKSCWGGMVAFNARPFQAEKPLRFRGSEELFWDASECCLIHADIAATKSIYDTDDLGIYMNPFVRVAYSERTLSWLPFAQRFERMFTFPQWIINRMVGLPWYNPRRTEQARSWIDREVWVPDYNLETGGTFKVEERKSNGDGFCGRRGMQLLKENPKVGEKNWEEVSIP